MVHKDLLHPPEPALLQLDSNRASRRSCWWWWVSRGQQRQEDRCAWALCSHSTWAQEWGLLQSAPCLGCPHPTTSQPLPLQIITRADNVYDKYIYILKSVCVYIYVQRRRINLSIHLVNLDEPSVCFRICLYDECVVWISFLHLINDVGAPCGRLVSIGSLNF